jgi:hypothetical protein
MAKTNNYNHLGYYPCMMLIFFNIKGFSKPETSNKKPIYCGLQRWETLVYKLPVFVTASRQ